RLLARRAARRGASVKHLPRPLQRLGESRRHQPAGGVTALMLAFEEHPVDPILNGTRLARPYEPDDEQDDRTDHEHEEQDERHLVRSGLPVRALPHTGDPEHRGELWTIREPFDKPL